MTNTSLETLLTNLQHENPDIRAEAATDLGEHDGKVVLPHLIEALKDANIRVRANAAEALGLIKDKRAVPPLVEALKREMIVDNLIDSQSTETKDSKEQDSLDILFNVFGKLSNNHPESVRMEILWAFRNIHNDDAVQLTLMHLNDKSNDLRMTAAEVLGRIKDPGTIRALEILLETEKDQDIRETALEAIELIKGK